MQAPADPFTFDAASETVLDTLRDIWWSFLSHLPLLAAGMVVLLVTAVIGVAARIAARRLLRGVGLRQSLKDLIERVVVVGVWIAGLLLTAMVVFPGVSPADALAALGIGSIAIGLAFRDIFENFFAGVLILWRFPFENGDFISCNGQTGRVVTVTVRNTVLRTVEGELVVLPNSTIYKNPVEVLTHQPVRRLTIIAGVAYGENVAHARDVIRRSVEACRTIAEGRPVEIFAREFADSSINFEVTWWTGATPQARRESRDEVVEAVKRGLDEAGIEIPFPQRSLWFRDGVRVEAERRDNAQDHE